MYIELHGRHIARHKPFTLETCNSWFTNFVMQWLDDFNIKLTAVKAVLSRACICKDQPSITIKIICLLAEIAILHCLTEILFMLRVHFTWSLAQYFRASTSVLHNTIPLVCKNVYNSATSLPYNIKKLSSSGIPHVI